MSTSTNVVDSDHVAAPAVEKPSKSRNARAVVMAIGAAAVMGGGFWYVTHRGLESTDDAQVDTDIVSVPARTSATVVKIHVKENQQVKAGDLLAELDAEPAKARLAQAEASVDAAKASAEAADADARVAETNARGNKSIAEASLQGAANSASVSKQQIAEGEAQLTSATVAFQKATTDLDRAKTLLASGAIAQAQFDQNQALFDTTSAALEQAKAHRAALMASTSQANSRVQEANAKLEQSSHVDVLIDQARARARMAHAQVATSQAVRDLMALDLSYTKIVAPQDGAVSKKSISVGQMVAPGQVIVQVVPDRQAWVAGNFKETQLRNMRAGQPAHLTVDAYPGLTFEGDVESFSAATGSRFSLLPPDNASGNFTKVVQRVPVRIALHDVPAGIVLRPGMSVELTVDTRK